MNKVLGFVLALGVMLAVATVDAQSKPNFTGDWKMNLVKSDFGAAPAPDTMTRKIVHAEPALTIDEEQATPIGPRSAPRGNTLPTEPNRPSRPAAPLCGRPQSGTAMRSWR